jgi:hypothetical protein
LTICTPPHFTNFNKRLVKAPKLYFIDTGLAAWLLGIRDKEQIAFHAQRGALFENLVITEFLKGRFNRGRQADICFWRDSKGLEVDLLLEEGLELTPVEIKSGQTHALHNVPLRPHVAAVPVKPKLAPPCKLVPINWAIWAARHPAEGEFPHNSSQLSRKPRLAQPVLPPR